METIRGLTSAAQPDRQAAFTPLIVAGRLEALEKRLEGMEFFLEGLMKKVDDLRSRSGGSRMTATRPATGAGATIR
jgi:hypothetical protein